jgi:hypothetical protein
MAEFLENKYKRWYDQLIERARGRNLVEDTERHHIVPRVLGGSNNQENIVRLTFREHFLAHWLLTKFTSGKDRYRMLYALGYITSVSKKNGRAYDGWQYKLAKRARVEAAKNRSPETLAKMDRTGQKNTPETIARMVASNTPAVREKKSKARKGKKNTPEHNAAISKSLKESEAHKAAAANLVGKPRPKKVRKKISKTRIERQIRNSPESIEQGAARKRGRKDSDETRANKSEAAKNRPPPTVKTKAKISESSINMAPEKRANITAGSGRPEVREAKSKALTGRGRSEEAKAAISAGKTGLKATEEAKASLRQSWEETREARRAALRAGWVKRKARQSSSML